MSYAKEQVLQVAVTNPKRFEEVKSKINWKEDEVNQWEAIAEAMYFPKHPTEDLFLQQDGFLDKELFPTTKISKQERPINQHWSWDRILRSPYIKQADVLQGFYFFEEKI